MTMNSTSEGWRYIAAWLTGYFIAEALIRVGIHPEWTGRLHSLAAIAAYDVTTERKNQLAIHLIVQTAVAAAYVIYIRTSISKAIAKTGDVTWKEIIAGLFILATLAWITYTPISSEPVGGTHRLRIIHFLVIQSNIAYAAILGLSVYGMTLGSQLMLIGISNKIRCRVVKTHPLEMQHPHNDKVRRTDDRR